MIHELKILSKYFNAILSKKKTFEVRFDDRNYYECKFTKYSMSDDGFCSFGARMDGDTE